MTFLSTEAWPEHATDLGLGFLPSEGQGPCFSEESPWWTTSGQGPLLIAQTFWKHLPALETGNRFYTFTLHILIPTISPNELFLYFSTQILLQFLNKWHFFATPLPRQKVGSETTCWARCNHNHLSCEYLHVLGLCSRDKGHKQQLGVMPSSHRSEEVCGETGSPLLETPKLRSQDTLNSQLFSLNPWPVAKLETLKNVTCIFQLGSSSILNSDLALPNRSQEKIATLFTYRARPMLLSAHLHLLIPT